MSRFNEFTPVADNDGVEAAVLAGRPTVWLNPARRVDQAALLEGDFTPAAVVEAGGFWSRAKPLLGRLFGEEAIGPNGIASPLLDITNTLSGHLRRDIRLLVKADHALPITGTVKARGATFEIIKHAEDIARAHNLSWSQDLTLLADAEYRALFAAQTILVGSTGNLGFCVGKVARALGFDAEIHMSRDAKSWKKDRLSQLGATVVEHAGDYGAAVDAARTIAKANPRAYFVDDENSKALFEGYSAAALELAAQLDELKIGVSAEQRLVVYLPCGVGGAPGGITYGLKSIFGPNVTCIWVEPVESPAMLASLTDPAAAHRSVYDCGRSNMTEADGLAVARASPLVVRNLRHLIDAIVTVTDEAMLHATADFWYEANLKVEPSAAVGLAALGQIRARLLDIGVTPHATHVVWTTGGSQLPVDEFDRVLKKVTINP